MSAPSIAVNRFGLGLRGDEQPPGEPRSWLLAQIERFEARPQALAQVPTRAEVAGDLAEYLAQARMDGRAKRQMPTMGAAMAPGAEAGQARLAARFKRQMPPMDPATTTGGKPGDELPDSAKRFLRRGIRDNYMVMNSARLASALTTTTPFSERLVHFWANHFAVSADKLPVVGLAGLLEFEAIRPNLLGRFADMLLAVEKHPAMLIYLDQAQSVGPSSPLALRLAQRQGKQRGLNENLAREILELHTLGVRTGYSQGDVTEFARALTGWTVGGIARGPAARLLGGGAPGEFRFAEPIHEPGDRTILGRRYGQSGERQALAVLGDLAVHPATARHIATKLARHFGGDEPPPAMVSRLEQSFLKSGGDLPTLYRALIDSPEAWEDRPLKFRSPWEWSVAALRAVGSRELEPQIAAGLMTQLGQPTWKPGSPAGWDDVAASWAGPDALVRRVEAAERLAGRAGSDVDARLLAQKLFPAALSETTRTAIARAESPGQGLALLLVSPEFQRR